ncbi:MAG: hypothetical protein ACRDK1_07770 [Solirubrobacterales bacterium]
MNRRPRWWVIVVGVAVWLVAAPSAGAETARSRLVASYSPIVMLRAQQDPPCDTSEEQFEPTTVNTMLGNPRVNLTRPAEGGRPQITRPAPTAAEVAGLGGRWHLDVPGDPLNAGCTYARDFAALTAAGRAPPITYAHIATQKGHAGFVIQYWFFYYFNQFNDLHEGDWEGMQIAFDASSVREAMSEGPSEIALFQHGGGEKASWDDGKVEKEGTHPVVYPAAGSHATFFDSAVYVENGQGGSGLGCDNTTEPLRRVKPTPVLMPTNPPPGTRFQWLTFDGHWGQMEKGFNNGPQGPTTKSQWREPFTWMDGLREASPKLPGGLVLGPQVTRAFCGAVATASSFVNLEAQTRLGAIVTGLVLVLLVAVPVGLTRWTPVDLSRLRQTRAFGQLVRAARQLYGRHWIAMVSIALSAIAILATVEGAVWLVTELTGGIDLGVTITISVPTIARSLGFAAVAGAVIAFVRDLEREGEARVGAAYGAVLARVWRVVFVQLIATFVVALMALTVIGIPFAIWKYVEWQFAQQEVLFKDRSIREALRGSSRLVRGHWWRTVRVVVFLWLLSIVTGPMLTFALIFTTLSLTWINILGSLVFALLIPYVAIGRTLLYFDLEVLAEQGARAPGRLRRLWSRARPSPQPG